MLYSPTKTVHLRHVLGHLKRFVAKKTQLSGAFVHFAIALHRTLRPVDGAGPDKTTSAHHYQQENGVSDIGHFE